MKKTNLRHAIFLALGLTVSNFGHAIGLGPIAVKSFYGQPVVAEIEVTGVDNPEQTIIRLAGHEAYATRGIKRNPSHEKLKFALKSKGKGKYYIAVNSAEGISDPFVNFLLTVNNNGKVITREYSLFLEPDPMAAAGLGQHTYSYSPNDYNRDDVNDGLNVAVVRTEERRSASGVSSSAKRINIEKNQAAKAQTGNFNNVASAARTPPSMDKFNNGVYGPIQSGETLFSIANALRPENVDVRTMINAIRKNNPHAFVSGKSNSLKVGESLRIPTEVNVAKKPEAPVNKNTSRAQKKQKTSDTYAPQSHETKKKVEKEALPQENKKLTTATANNIDTSVSPNVIAEQMSDNKTSAAPEMPENSGLQALPNDNQMPASENMENQEDLAKQAEEEAKRKAEEEERIAAEKEAERLRKEEEAKRKAEEAKKLEAMRMEEAKKKALQSASDSHNHTHEHNHEEDGFPWWIVGAGAGAAGISALGLFLLLRRRKKNQETLNEELSEEDIAKIIADLPPLDEEESDSEFDAPKLENNLADKFDNFKEDLSNFKFDKNLDEKFEETDIDSFSDFASNDEFSKSENTEENKISFDELTNDFFTTDDDNNFFSQTDFSADKKEEISSDSGELDFSTQNLDDFFMDDNELSSIEKTINDTTETVTSITSDDFMDNFFSDFDSAQKEESPAIVEEKFEEKDDFSLDFNLDDDFSMKIDDLPAPELNIEPVEIKEEKSDLDFMSFDTFSLEDENSKEETPSTSSEDLTISSVEVDEGAMEINLDLASSLLATGSSDRARAWLEEVLLKGTELQKSQAKEMLAQIDLKNL